MFFLTSNARLVFLLDAHAYSEHFKTVRVGWKTPHLIFSFSFSTSKSSYITAEVLTQCLQSERAKKVKRPLQKKGITDVGCF